jgi:hypothetical protein
MGRNGDRFGFFHLALRGSAFLFVILLLAGISLPALAASSVTGVTVTPTTASVNSGQAVYVRATVQGSGDFDHRVTWSLSPLNAGTLTPTGLFISAPAFSGSASVKATSGENPKFSGTATITVAAGDGVVHVDHNNAGDETGTALQPYRTIQAAVDQAADGETIKVAQGIYIENVVLSWQFGVLLLGGFKGGSPADYAANIPGDFVNRDHLNQVTTIQSPARTTAAIFLESLGLSNPLTYAVDGFTVTGGSHGLQCNGDSQVEVFISQNLITANGTIGVANGGGISASGARYQIMNNRIASNQSGSAGGLFLSSPSPFLIQGNIIENNSCGTEYGGGVWLYPGTGLFTWNLVRSNRSCLLSTYGYAGGIWVSGNQLELSHNIYTDNQALDFGGGIVLAQASTAILRHELIFKNRTTSENSGGAGIAVSPSANLTMDHCTITGNTSAGVEGSGLYVRESATTTVTNSIIWGNSGNQLYVDPQSSFTMTYSDSQPYTGTGNISVDPLFADPDTDDYHLKSWGGRWNPGISGWVWDKVNSPCIDAGNPASAFDQEPIPNGSRTNMGVYGNTPEASRSQAVLEGTFQMLLLVD